MALKFASIQVSNLQTDDQSSIFHVRHFADTKVRPLKYLKFRIWGRVFESHASLHLLIAYETGKSV